jgi:acetolactate synthase-1/2/3 large subunit
MTGAQALIRALELERVDVMFGLPGGCILPAYDPLLESSIRHVLVRHEQGAGHMAEGYAHVTGKPGVAMVTSGPAATNLVTPLMDAYMDSIPMVGITGQVSTPAIGTDAFQECDTLGITRSCTKHNELVMTAEEIPMAIRQAFHIASTGRPGPTLVDLPKDVLQNEMTWYWPSDDEVAASLPGYRPTTKGHPRMIREAARLIMESERPVLYIGGGMLKARAAEALRELVDLTGIHLVTTLMARGVFPDDHPMHLGMPGMHGTATATTAMQKADLLIALGARFDDRITGKVASFAPDAKIIHVDIDPAEQGKVRRPDVPIVGDCRLVTEELVKAIRDLREGGAEAPDRSAWKSRISGWQEQFPLTYEPSEPGAALKPQFCLERLRDAAPEGTILTSGVGQHQMWSSLHWNFREPYTWVNSGGLGTMGFSIPAAIGAKVGRPDRTVWAVDGDGCFQMTAQELVTASVERIPIKVALLNNSYLGMVRQWQEMFYDERYSEVYLSTDCPDYVKWAEAMGCVGIRV